MLVFIGLGLGDEKDLTLRALKELQTANEVFLEAYTTPMPYLSIETLSSLIGKEVKVLPREEVEFGEGIIKAAERGKACLLVGGDAMTATTHTALRLRAEEKGIETKIVHAASILTAAPSILGLQHYKFGRTVSLPRPSENYWPISPYHHTLENFRRGLHTLLLLDTGVEGKKPLSAEEALQIMKEMEEREKKGLFTDERLICVVARAGSEKPLAVADAFSQLLKHKFGQPPHTIVVPGELHFLEEEALKRLGIGRY